MRMGYRITLSILTIMILMTISVGSSYSYYAVSSTQEEPNYLSTTCFNISFEEEDSINLTNTYPMSEYDALHKLKPYKFTVTNTCTTGNASADTKYILTLNTLIDKPAELAPYINHKLLANKGLEEDAVIMVYAGDVNADGKADSTDSAKILNALAGTKLDEAQNYVGDINNDGKADSTDSVKMLNALAGTTTLPIKNISYLLNGASAYEFNNAYLNNKYLYVKHWEKSNGIITNLTTTDENVKLSLLESEVSADIDTSYTLDVSSLSPGESIEYGLYLWIPEDACNNTGIINDANETECEANVMGKSFEAKILLYAYM